MGIYVTQQQANFRLKGDCEQTAFQDLLALALRGASSYPYQGEQTLDDLLYQCWGWSLERPGDEAQYHNKHELVQREPLSWGIGVVFLGEYYNDAWKALFAALAPYVEPGSSVEWVLEIGDRERGGVTFDGMRATFHGEDD